MKRLGIIVLLISSLFIMNSVSLVGGIEFTATDYWFFIEEPTLINYTEMAFSIKNELNTNVMISCQPEKVIGLNITTYLAWENLTLTPNDIAENHYAFMVNENFASDYIVRIFCYQTIITDDGGQKTSTGGIITNRISYYSDEEGSLLDLKILDQSGSPRNSSVTIYYKKSKDYAWAPIQSFEGNRYIGYLPNGLYEVIANDWNSSIIGKTIFELTEDMEINVELFLLGFGRFQFEEIETDDSGTTIIGINSTINNFLGPIDSVNVYLKLFKDGELFSETQKFKIETLPQTTDYEIIMWFSPITWETGNYTIVGYIDTFELTLSTKLLQLGSYITSEDKFNNSIKDHMILGTIIMGLPVMAFLINRSVLPRYRYKCSKCHKLNFNWYKFCNSCGTKKEVVINEI